MYKISKQKGWYKALRYVQLLVQSEAWSALEHFIEQVPCREEIQFQCGIYSEIEKAWKTASHAGNTSNMDQLTALYRKLSSHLISIGSVTQSWVGIVGNTMGISSTESVNLSRSRWSRKAKSYSTTLEAFFRWPNLEPNNNALLRDTWSDAGSSAIKIMYTDLAMEEYYKLSKRLHIERLSGQLLPMDKCYINLTIEDKSVAKEDKHEKQTFSPEERLRLEASPTDSRIELQDLFEKRQRGSEAVEPRRIFIQGRAGIGKTTLCKKIVYEFFNETLCSGKFDRLLWLPLRRLRLADGKDMWERLLADELAQTGSDLEALVKVFIRQLEEDQTFCKRTLFLLDGLDEVALHWPEDSSVHRFLTRLLAMPSVIITSRPQTKSLDIGDFDLELETVGFLPDQVQSYLQHCVKDESLVSDINNFLQARPLLQGLVRIPIQLDAFCFTWLSENRYLAAGSNTMTMLYHSICLELNKKDIVRLEKVKELHSNNVNLLGSFEVKDILQHEQQYLEFFAFQGLYNNIIEFSHQHQDLLGGHLHAKMVHLDGPFKVVLEKLSFLRSSNSGVDESIQHQNVHFLHLTFQEFFAARYFVHHWQHDQQISCLKLGPEADIIGVMPKAFLQHEKYNPRYHMFWRFVTGLIQIEGKSNTRNDSLRSFFDTLELPPQDILGHSHHRLLMYSLNEVIETNDKTTSALQEKLRRQLYHWAILEAKAFYNCFEIQSDQLNRTRFLTDEVEFPEIILYELLNNTNMDVRGMTIRSLMSEKRPKPRDAAWKAFVDLVADPCQNFYILQSTIWITWQKEELSSPMEFVYAMISLLGHSDEDVSHLAVHCLSHFASLPMEAIELFLSVIKNSSYLRLDHTSFRLHDFMKKLPPLSQCRLIDLLDLMNHQDKGRRFLVVRILDRMCQYQEIDMTAIFDKVGVGIRRALMDVFHANTTGRLSDALLMTFLQDRFADMRFEVLDIIRSRRQTSNDVFKALVTLTKHDDYRTRVAAITAMEGCYLTDETEQSLLLLLEQSDVHTQEAACAVLSTSPISQRDTPNIPHNAITINRLIEMVAGQDDRVRTLAARVLKSKTLLDSQLETLHNLLKREDEELRKLILLILQGRCVLSIDVLKTLMAMMESANDGTFRLCMRIVEEKFCFTEETVLTVERWFRGSSSRLRVAAITACIYGKRLPEITSDHLIKLLIDDYNHTNSKTDATSIYPCESKLSTNGIRCGGIVSESYDLQIAAIKALTHRSLPQLVYDACIQWLRNGDPALNKASVGAIKCMSQIRYSRILNSVHILLYLVYHFQDQNEDCHQKGTHETVYLKIMEFLEKTAFTDTGLTLHGLVPIVIDLLRSPLKRLQAIGAHILNRAPDLSPERIQALTDFWLSKLERPRDALWTKSIFGPHAWYVKILARQATLSEKTINSLVCLYTWESNYEGMGRGSRRIHQEMLRSIAAMLINQIAQGNLTSLVVVALIQQSNLMLREILLLELIIQKPEHELVSSFSDEILETFCVVYLRRARTVETRCYHRPDGIYICEGDQERNLNLNPEQQNNFVQIMRRVKLKYGFIESSETELSGIDSG